MPTNTGARSATWFLTFLSLINNFSQLEEQCGCNLMDKVLGWGAGRFFHLDFFKKGNEQNGEQEQEQQQLK